MLRRPRDRPAPAPPLPPVPPGPRRGPAPASPGRRAAARSPSRGGKQRRRRRGHGEKEEEEEEAGAVRSRLGRHRPPDRCGALRGRGRPGPGRAGQSRAGPSPAGGRPPPRPASAWPLSGGGSPGGGSFPAAPALTGTRPGPAPGGPAGRRGSRLTAWGLLRLSARPALVCRGNVSSEGAPTPSSPLVLVLRPRPMLQVWCNCYSGLAYTLESPT